MALLWMDGFDWLTDGTNGVNSDAALTRRYTGGDVNMTAGTDGTAVTGFGGGTAIEFAETSHLIQTPAVASSTSVIMGFAYKQVGNPTTQRIAAFREGATSHLGLEVTSVGSIVVKRGTTDLTELGLLIVQDVWYYIELKGTMHDTTGSWELRLNGVSIGSDTNVDTQAGGTGVIDNMILRGGSASTSRTIYDDWYFADTSGSDNNDFLGVIKVKSMHPDTDGDLEDWTTSTGTDSTALIDELSPADDDTTYIESSTTADTTLANYASVPSGTASIKGIVISTHARTTDATNFDLINTVKQGGTEYPQSAQTISNQTYAHYDNIIENDPNTTTAWTESGLNSVQTGVEVG